ncbi:hypothetical protein GCM10011571_05800 [Marinithermofilum abyssi]|uniref:Uncharacterized protein n=1 Tax=Marinithermofilum abyssi TaxID=1571185 RepID=A0A8J2VDB0_9BACL|nr:hypothetical protein [Marinithermofilum abyssi]GGE07394.1 hypothetical protein GCM10011571_05800 [Marinithermofilum abyssi]
MSFDRGLWGRVLFLLVVLNIMRIAGWLNNSMMFILLGLSLGLIGFRLARKHWPRKGKRTNPSQRWAFTGYIVLVYVIIGCVLAAYEWTAQ